MNLQVINIQQSLNTSERIDHYILGEIYKAYKNPSFKATKSTLKGMVSVDFAYDFWINELQRKWSNFKITADGLYHNWDDPVFREGIAKIWGDGYGVPESQLNSPKSFGCTESECKAGPFWHNTEVEVMDLRPFTNINSIDSKWNYFRIHAHNEDWDHTQKRLKEIYVQVKGGNAKTDFWGGMTNSEHLEKLWIEGNKNPSTPCLNWISVDGSQTIIDHYYFRNNCTIPSATIKRDNGTTLGYICPQNGWQFRGWWAQNIIVDSPMPLQLNTWLGWGNGVNRTTFWVPDHQLQDYIQVFNLTTGDEARPKSIRTFTDYNIAFPKFANWYVYPGIDLYNNKDTYMYADGNDI